MKTKLVFSNYLSDINPEFEFLVQRIHDKMVEWGCQVKLQESKSGHVVSFVDAKTDKTVANFVSRKKGPTVRIYADNLDQYAAMLPELPKAMVAQLEKASACRRLLDPTKCNARCPMGYVYTLNGTEHKKCRYNCFMFLINEDTAPSILTLLEREMAGRSA
ncbi:hypothetical protein LJC63_12475 [Ruminococcaceae bacterium OttesenSCG-928-L11]|nr:hypothetical protein [Ruminococcaceae bacterium OttesenSCG-928-L11]